ncbi:permease of the major facilitator superfamily protein [Bifidobacterium actinocoloniiforme DSM 22766]|uniref:Permease of the major facilitator superfamily protein n=1 Tax=Bifidobacterium actinocoloniiforme DSM 22766 TaxID=1437605 RepID=A0A086Z0R3_9BIFI|nr:MFS transporter [Bifidobacterium actinocoloniiforme]AKV55319.1 MFS transporter permease [Bifidobacterium actinocoloniiforme DSM 22766]KFI40113.1 permease of the major facilitator superfamily protein [Bifidobacterium actinocoloniiforme DSM 22766]
MRTGDKPVNTSSPLLMLGVLSISFLMSVSNAVSGTIPLMKQYFSNISEANVELLVVIPTGGVLLGTVVSGLISNKLGKKYTVLMGLIVSLIFGVIPAFFYSYPAIFLSRAMFGVGMGIFTPLSVSYITDIFPERIRNRLLGWRNSVGAIGDAIMLFIAGFLINVSWHATYLVFLFLIVPIVLVALFVPKRLDRVTVEEGKEVEEDSDIRPSTNGGVIQLAIVFLFVCLFYSSISLKLASHMVDSHIGSAADATRIFGFLVLCSIVSGIAFEQLAKWCGKATVFIFEMLTAVVLIAMPFANSIPVLLVLVLVAGFCNGIINPALTARMVAYSPKGSMNLTTSIILIGINIGSLVAPYFFQALGLILGNRDSGFMILCAGVCYILLAFYDVFIVRKDKLTI